MSLISAPPQNEFIDQRSIQPGKVSLAFAFGGARPTTAWATFFSNIFQIVQGMTLSGTTAQRPKTFLYIGRRYFDTSLGAHGKPIWVASVSAGAATWIDAASNVV